MKYGMLVLPVQGAQRYMEVIGRETQMQFEEMNTLPGTSVTKWNVDEFLANDGAYTLDEVEAELQGLYKRFNSFKENNANMMAERNRAFEELQVIKQALAMHGTAPPRATTARPGNGTNDLQRSLLGNDADGETRDDRRMCQIAGVIDRA